MIPANPYEPTMQFNGTIRIAATVNNPYVLFDESTRKWSGILISLLQAACLRLSYRCDISMSSSDPGNHKEIDEVLLGVFGDVHNGTTDAGVSPVSITANRFRNFSFVDSFLRRTYVAIIHQDYLVSANPSEFIFRLLQALAQKEVWISICGVFCVMVLFGAFSEVLDKRDPAVTTSKSTWVQVSIKWIFRIFGTGLGIQGIEDFEITARSNYWRISKITFTFFWSVYTFFILCTLAGALPSMFSFETGRKLPFSTVKQLLDSKFVAYSSPTLIFNFNVSKTAFHATLAKQMQILPDKTDNKAKIERYLELAKSERCVLIIDLDALLEISYLNCEMIVAIDNFYSLPIAGIILPRDSPLQPIFEYGYSTIKDIGFAQMGIRDLGLFLASAVRTHTKNRQMSSCYRRKLNQGPVLKENQIHLQTLEFVFLFFAGSVAVALIVLISELIFSKLS